MPILPTPDGVSGLLATLLPGSVSVKPSTPVALGPKAPAMAGVYTGDDGSLRAVCICDFGAVAFCGASLAMIPAGAARDSQKSGQIPENILENFREILNIFGQVLNQPGQPHLSFKTLLPPAETGTPEITALLSKPGGRLDLEINISNYGVGKMSIVMAA